MKKVKYRKTKKGNGWNKEKNMSNNAVKAFKNGFTTWNDFDKSYFIGDELEDLHFLVAHLYVRHHFGNKKQEIYMFPINILDIVGSEEQDWKYFLEDYPQEAGHILELKQIIEERKSLVNNMKIELDNETDESEKIKIALDYLLRLSELVESEFYNEIQSLKWSANIISNASGFKKEINNFLNETLQLGGYKNE